MSITSTRLRRHINAPRVDVYRALLDSGAVAKMITFTLTEADGGTEVLGVHNNLPPGVSPADNETGWRMALDKLAALVEAS
jgi:uncharacterized protein YndB with AHSA1/START domain